MSKYVGKEELGSALHTALRKCCDSAATSAAYNCITLMPDSLWGEYIAVVGEYLGAAKKAKRLTEENAWEHLLFASTQENSQTYVQSRDSFTDALQEWRDKKGFYCAGKPKDDRRMEKGRCTIQCQACREQKKDSLPKPKPPLQYESMTGARVYDPGDLSSDERENMVKLIKSLPDAETASRTPGDIEEERRRWRYLFQSILRSFNDDDWKGFASFLFYGD